MQAKKQVRTGHGKTDWFQIVKGVCQGCIPSPAYLTYMPSSSCTMPAEAQAGIKVARRNISNLKYADDTTFMVETKE